MIKASLDKQLMITVDNKMGTLADITRIVSSSGINLVAACAYAIDNKGFIIFVTQDNKKAKKILEAQNYDVREEEVVLVALPNEPGALQKLSEAIANAGIDLALLYGSVEKNAKTSCLILVAEDNRAVLTIIRMIK